MASRFVLIDTNVFCAWFLRDDPNHLHAQKIIKSIKTNEKIILPPLGIFEIIATLAKRGIDDSQIKQIVFNLASQAEIVIAQLADLQFANNVTLFKNIEHLRTHDFYVLQTGMKFGAKIYSFDQSFVKRGKVLYKDIYDKVRR